MSRQAASTAGDTTSRQAGSAAGDTMSRRARWVIVSLTILAIAGTLTGCGRYGRPVRPKPEPAARFEAPRPTPNRAGLAVLYRGLAAHYRGLAAFYREQAALYRGQAALYRGQAALFGGTAAVITDTPPAVPTDDRRTTA